MRDFIIKNHEHAKMSIYKSIACVSTSGCDASNTSSSHGMDQASHKVLWDICPYLLEHVSKFLEYVSGEHVVDVEGADPSHPTCARLVRDQGSEPARG